MSKKSVKKEKGQEELVDVQVAEAEASEPMQENNIKEADWTMALNKDINDALNRFMPISHQAGWAVKYHNKILETYENGTVKYDNDAIVGVTMYIQFDFVDTYKTSIDG